MNEVAFMIGQLIGLLFGVIVVVGIFKWVINLFKKKKSNKTNKGLQNNTSFNKHKEDDIKGIEKLYEIAWNEVENNKTSKSLWAMSFSKCHGDIQKTKAMYIDLRVNEIKQEKNKQITTSKSHVKQYNKEETEITVTDNSTITKNLLNQGLTQEDIDYLGNPIRASKYLKKHMFPQKDLDKLIGEGKIKGSIVNGALWVQDIKVK